MGVTTASNERVIAYTHYGAASDLFWHREREILLGGPAGTGKSRACLEKINGAAHKYPMMRGLMLRKTLVSFTSSGLVTFRQKVLQPGDGVEFFGGNKQEPAHYRYPNGSQIVVGGLDDAGKVMSTEYDMIYVQEATDLVEDDWERLTTRLRNHVMPYQQLVADCNPNAPTHWLKQRCDRGACLMLYSVHADNPTMTPDYLATLDALTGVRRLRLRDGIWAAAEGMVWEEWNPAIHLIDRVPTLMDAEHCDPRGVPTDWPRYWVVDFGYTNPFVWQEWAQDDDGRLYRVQEIYRTQGLVEDHAKDIIAATVATPAPRAVICDHDAEGRATLERHLGYATMAAHKAVTAGIQAVAGRLRVAPDGLPRLFLLRDALVMRDAALAEKRKPCSTEEEIDGYVWDVANNRKRGEEPLKENDHGCDALRYMVAHRDLVGDVTYAPSLYE
jgi:phage terminase large subunit